MELEDSYMAGSVVGRWGWKGGQGSKQEPPGQAVTTPEMDGQARAGGKELPVVPRATESH